MRQELLGTEASRLSESLLKKIAWQTLDAHRACFQIGGGNYREIARAAAGPGPRQSNRIDQRYRQG